MKAIYKKIFISSYNLSILKTFFFNVFKLKQAKISIYLGKDTRIFNTSGNISVKKAYFDSKNAGQYTYGSKVILGENSQLILGNSVNFYSGAQIKCFNSSRIEVGDDTYFSGPVTLHSKKSIKIGKRCSISWNVTIIDSDFHKASLDGEIRSEGVIISDDVWIGCNVTILKGVKVGKGAIIAAGSVVTKSIGDYEVYAGNPAKRMR